MLTHEGYTQILFPIDLAVQEKIPLLIHGVEEVQLAIMNYVMTELKTGQPSKEEVPAPGPTFTPVMRESAHKPMPGN